MFSWRTKVPRQFPITRKLPSLFPIRTKSTIGFVMLGEVICGINGSPALKTIEHLPLVTVRTAFDALHALLKSCHLKCCLMPWPWFQVPFVVKPLSMGNIMGENHRVGFVAVLASQTSPTKHGNALPGRRAVHQRYRMSCSIT